VRPLYGRFAWAYDAVVAQPAGGSVDLVADRVRAAGVERGALVVDAGCGTGRYAIGLVSAGFRVVGVDRSEALVEQARRRDTGAEFVCADLLDWRPAEAAAAVLCRGVLNDLVRDGDRRAAFAAFASWLEAGGVLLADVRDWEATRARYANRLSHERSVGSSLRFTSKTALDVERRLVLVRERYVTPESDESYEFAMRCWTGEELREHARAAGFSSVEIVAGAEAGIAPDRLLLTARK
jgi:SAM-dependent methyltransferase